MTQLLKNSKLLWDGKTENISWQTPDGSSIKNVSIENPVDWRYIYEHLELRNQVPQSLHKDNEGFDIATGYQRFHCGYTQSQVEVVGGTRAVFRLTYNLQLHAGRQPFGKLVVEGVDVAESDWTGLAGANEKLFVVHFLRSGMVTVKALFASVGSEGIDDASIVMDCIVTGLTLDTVPADYGGDAVKKVLPIVLNEPPVPPPPPVVPPTTKPDFSWPLLIIAGLIVLALVVFALTRRPASAQALDVEIISIEEAARMLLLAIAAIVAGAGQSVFVSLLVPLLKLAFRQVSAPVLTLGAAVLITVIVWISRVLGMEAQLNTLFDLLKVVLPPLVALLTSLFGAKSIYALARKHEVAYVGWQRSVPPASGRPVAR